MGKPGQKIRYEDGMSTSARGNKNYMDECRQWIHGEI